MSNPSLPSPSSEAPQDDLRCCPSFFTDGLHSAGCLATPSSVSTSEPSDSGVARDTPTNSSHPIKCPTCGESWYRVGFCSNAFHIAEASQYRGCYLHPNGYDLTCQVCRIVTPRLVSASPTEPQEAALADQMQDAGEQRMRDWEKKYPTDPQEAAPDGEVQFTQEDARTILRFFRANGIDPAPLSRQPKGTMYWRLLTLAGEP